MVTTPNPDVTTVRDILRAVPFFRELTQPELACSWRWDASSLPQEQGCSGRATKGSPLRGHHSAVRITSMRRTWDGISFVEAGGCFGEMALVDDFPRSATAIAQDDCTVLFLGRDALLDLFREEPVVGRKILAAFCRSLSLRLRHASDRIVALSSLQRGA
jgi:CRP-like cAMP-binding protein